MSRPRRASSPVAGPTRLVALGVLLLGAAPPGPTVAQEPGAETCRAVYGDVLEERLDREDACFALAVRLIGGERFDARYLTPSVDSVLAPRDVQQRNGGDANMGGSLGQGEAVPTAQPLAIGGGSVSVVGSDAGTDGITALSLNPALFFTSTRDDETTARRARLADLAVLFPVDDLDRDDDGEVDYVGVRARVNFTGAGAGSEILERAREKFQSLVAAEARKARELADLFETLPRSQLRSCVDAVRGEEGPDVEGACGGGLVLDVDEEAYAEFRRHLAAVREEADSRYLGLDLRFDTGDPTLGAVPDAEATSLTAGLAFGRQFVGADPRQETSAGIRGRLGARYTDLENVDETSLGVDGGLSFTVRRSSDDFQTIVLSGGFEFRYSDEGAMEEELQTDFAIFRGTLQVPVTESASVSINVGAPLVGDVSSTLSVNANWGLLLPSLGLSGASPGSS